MRSDDEVHGSSGAPVPFPRVELIGKPSPLLPLKNLSDSLGSTSSVQVWAKREDLIPLGLGGNKMRNMEFLLAEAQQLSSDRIIVFGRPGSNHCRLAAAAAAYVALPATVVTSGRRHVQFSASERLLTLLGAEVLYTDDEAPASAAALAASERDRLIRAGSQPYLMPPGASGVVGASGHVLAGLELARQAQQLGIRLDFVFVGMATGGTAAGLRVGLAVAGLRSTTIVGVPTHLALAASPASFGVDLHELTRRLLEAWSDPKREAAQPELGQMVIDDVPWNAYGATTLEGRGAQGRVGAAEGLLLDPIYTCHVAASLVRWAQRGKLDGKSVALWVGGGTPALFAGEMPTVA
ncbi:MAG: D-cysteine desulfhydrase [Actinomycetota bacterium]|nr:D-cysteine desulfhydrase [Actinomycetota bacterium]